MRRTLVLLFVAALLLQICLLGGCAKAAPTEQTGKVVGEVKASFPLSGLTSGKVSKLTVTSAKVEFGDGSQVTAKIDLPAADHVKLTKQNAPVRVQKRENTWFIVEALE